MGKTAIVVIHGIGNQFPMETAYNFARNLMGKQNKVFSSPNRVSYD